MTQENDTNNSMTNSCPQYWYLIAITLQKLPKVTVLTDHLKEINQ